MLWLHETTSTISTNSTISATLTASTTEASTTTFTTSTTSTEERLSWFTNDLELRRNIFVPDNLSVGEEENRVLPWVFHDDEENKLMELKCIMRGYNASNNPSDYRDARWSYPEFDDSQVDTSAQPVKDEENGEPFAIWTIRINTSAADAGKKWVTCEWQQGDFPFSKISHKFLIFRKISEEGNVFSYGLGDDFLDEKDDTYQVEANIKRQISEHYNVTPNNVYRLNEGNMFKLIKPGLSWFTRDREMRSRIFVPDNLSEGKEENRVMPWVFHDNEKYKMKLNCIMRGYNVSNNPIDYRDARWSHPGFSARQVDTSAPGVKGSEGAVPYKIWTIAITTSAADAGKKWATCEFQQGDFQQSTDFKFLIFRKKDLYPLDEKFVYVVYDIGGSLDERDLTQQVEDDIKRQISEHYDMTSESVTRSGREFHIAVPTVLDD